MGKGIPTSCGSNKPAGIMPAGNGTKSEVAGPGPAPGSIGHPARSTKIKCSVCTTERTVRSNRRWYKKGFCSKKCFLASFYLKPKDIIQTMDEYSALRRKVFKTYPNKCMACGSITRLEMDHIKPRHKYPELTLVFENLQILCHECNQGKGARDETDWRDKKNV